MISFNDCYRIGKIGKAHGYKGFVKIDLEGDFDLKINSKEPVFLEFHQKPVPFFYSEIKDCGDYLLVKFDDVNNEEDVAEISNRIVYTYKKWVKNYSAELAADALKDFQVYDDTAGYLGNIVEIIDHGKQKLMHIDYRGSELLVPLVEDLILKFKYEDKKITLKLPSGFLDIFDSNEN